MSIKTMQRALSAAKVADLYIKEKITGSENRKMAQQFLAKSNAELRAAIKQAQKPRREWQGLTEVEIVGMTCECVDDGTFNMDCAIDFARAIEARLKENNT